MLTNSELIRRLSLDEFPLSAKYDPECMIENQMGPNALWLAESLSQVMEFRPGMKVLDLGCGKAVTSIFLAREFGVQVWAADLWIASAENRARIAEERLESQIEAIDAEAHSLPFEEGFFDAVVSFDAYHYFGTDDLYIGYISKFLKPGGEIGIVVPGLSEELKDDPPVALQPYWYWDFWAFHSPAWWRRHWEKTGKVMVEVADRVPDGWQHWLRWNEVCSEHTGQDDEEAEMLRADGGKLLGFSRVVGRRPAETADERWRG